MSWTEKVLEVMPIFAQPASHKKDKGALLFGWILTFLYIVASVVFLSLFLPLSFINCAKTPVPTNEYNGNNCTCQNSVGTSASIGLVILQNSSFGQQFESFTNGGYFGIISCQEGLSCMVAMPYLAFYLTNYYPIEFSNQMTNLETDVFSIYQNNIFDEETTNNLLGGDSACALQIVNTTTGFGSYIRANSSTECLAMIREKVNPNFTSLLSINYLNNDVYRASCRLQTCQINQCSGLASLNILLLSSSILTFSFAILSVFRTIVFRFWYFREDRIEQIHLKSYVVPNV